MSACRMCGSSLLAAAPQTHAGPIYTPQPLAQNEPGFSKWLIVLAISLLVAPALRLYSIVSIEYPALFGDGSHDALAAHPGMAGILYFKIGMNALLILAALYLNVLFYQKSRRFPKWMIAYAVSTFFYLVAVASAVYILFPDLDTRANFYPLVRSMFWVCALIPYLLFSPDIKVRFDQ